MKRMNLFFFVLLISLLGNDLVSQYVNESDLQYCGTVEGYLLDEETLLPVNSRYQVFFIGSLRKEDIMISKFKINTTIKYGYFTEILPAGRYYLYCFPKENNYKYRMDIHPVWATDESQRFPIDIERGKITQVIKILKKGGSLKIVLVDINGKKIEPSKIFDNKFKITAYISSDSNILFGDFSSSNINDGEILIENIFYPSVYSMRVCFDGMGYPDVEIEHFKIETGKITTINVPVNLNDKTGIEGYVKDSEGKPIEGVNVSMTCIECKSQKNAEKTTGKDGYFRIIGLPEGRYQFYISFDPEYLYHSNADCYIRIEENKIIKKNVLAIRN